MRLIKINFSVLLIGILLLANSFAYAAGPGDGPPPPKTVNGVPPPPPGLAIDQGLLILLLAGILLAIYMLNKKRIHSALKKD